MPAASALASLSAHPPFICLPQAANGDAAASVPDIALHERQLAAAQQLAALLRPGAASSVVNDTDGGGAPEAAASEYLAAVQGALRADVAYLADVSRVLAATCRMAFCSPQCLPS